VLLKYRLLLTVWFLSGVLNLQATHRYDSDHFMPWVHQFTSVISGQTGSGKSVFVRRFAHNIRHMMTPIPARILWCYGEYQTLYRTVNGVDFQQGLPDLDNLDPTEKHLIILDDLLVETNQRVASLFTKNSHYRNISVMYIVQNLFHRRKHHRTISLTAHYMVIFQNPRDVSQIMALAHQMYPPLKILSAHIHRQSTRLRSALVMRWLRIHGPAFCKYTNSLACFFKRWENMLLLLYLS
jgi:hypothetical protein